MLVSCFNPADVPAELPPAVRSPIRVLAVTRRPDSQSFNHRIIQYVDPLRRHGIEVEPATLPRSAMGLWSRLSRASEFEVVWWHRHLLSPWWMPKLGRLSKAIIFDFDEPLPISRASGEASTNRRIRFAAMLRRSAVALAASESLARLAEAYCNKVAVLPTAVDLPDPPPPAPGNNGALELLWFGSASMLPHLCHIRPVLVEIGKRFPSVRLRLVAPEPIEFGSLKVDFRKWSVAEEQAGLRECHVGLCPMDVAPWTAGKCPYKVLQFMASGVPWIGTPVGDGILRAAGDGTRGVCACDRDDWLEAAVQLITDAPRRQRMGQACRAYAAEHHNRAAITQRLAEVIRGVAANRA